MNSSAFQSLFISSKDGARLHLKQLNAVPHGPRPIVLLHALAMSEVMWHEMTKYTQVGQPIWAIDLRGHGQSEIKPGPFTTSLFANDILSVLDHLEVKAAHLVGCSMGGTVAMAFASQYADRVASLGLIDTTACYGEQAQASWEARGMQAYNQGLKSLTQFQLHRWFSESFVESNPDLVSRCLDIFVKNDPGVYLASCRMLGAADERHGLSSYQGACNVIVGAQDYATPLAMSQEIVNILPQSRLHVLEGVRHYSPIEAPEEVATILHSLWSEN